MRALMCIAIAYVIIILLQCVTIGRCRAALPYVGCGIAVNLSYFIWNYGPVRLKTLKIALPKRLKSFDERNPLVSRFSPTQILFVAPTFLLSSHLCGGRLSSRRSLIFAKELAGARHRNGLMKLSQLCREKVASVHPPGRWRRDE